MSVFSKMWASLNSQNSSKEQSTNNKASTFENTIFSVHNIPEKGYFVAIGPNRLTNFKTTRAECELLILEKDWELIINLVSLSTKLGLEEMFKQPINNITQENGTTIIEP